MKRTLNEKIKDNKVFISILILLFFLFFPVLINGLTNWDWWFWNVPTSNDWISFFGSYGGSIFGGIFGGLIAVYVANIQIENQNKNNKETLDQQKKNFEDQLTIERESFNKQNRIDSRSFLRADTLIFTESPKMKYSNPPDIMRTFEAEVDNLKEDRNRKGAILLLVDYDNNRDKDAIFRSNMTSKYYIILEHFGNPEAIFNVTINITKGTKTDSLQCYSFSKNELLIIPDSLYFDHLEVRYTTLIGEKMLFKYNRQLGKFILTSEGINNDGIDGKLVDATMGLYSSIHL